MVSSRSVPASSDGRLRTELADLVDGIDPWDDLERDHLRLTGEWLAGGAPVHRTRKPDVPDTHLVSYFVVLDAECGELLLVAAVERECREEPGVPAGASDVTGEHPFFLTVTRTPVMGNTDRATGSLPRGRTSR